MKELNQNPSLSYRLFSVFLLPLWIFHAIWLSIKYKQPDYLWQRLCLSCIRSHPDIYFHASSVGEVDLIKPLVSHLLEKHSILVTTFTITGFQHAKRCLPKTVDIRFLPIDFWLASYHFYFKIQCKLAIFVETELWPEALFQLQKQNVPLLQVNARISKKTVDTNIIFRKIISTTLSYFDGHLTRTDEDAKNLINLGANKDKITVIGNLKYTSVPLSHGNEKYLDIINRPYILLASTHSPEEKKLTEACLNAGYEGLIVIAPRHPQRATDILKDLGQTSLKIAQRSKNQTITDDIQIYLADTLGELEIMINHSTLVIMGGSFMDYGGHNILQPAQLGKATITGPSDADFKEEIKSLLKHDAIIQVQDVKQLEDQLRTLLKQPNKIKELGLNAKKVISLQADILQRYISAIESYL